MLTLVLLLIFLIVVGLLWLQGLWSNAITLINTTLAAMVALNYFEPVANLLDKQFPSYTYLWDFLCAVGLIRSYFRRASPGHRHAVAASSYLRVLDGNGRTIRARDLGRLDLRRLHLRNTAHCALRREFHGISAEIRFGKLPGHVARKTVAWLHAKPIPRSTQSRHTTCLRSKERLYSEVSPAPGGFRKRGRLSSQSLTS